MYLCVNDTIAKGRPDTIDESVGNSGWLSGSRRVAEFRGVLLLVWVVVWDDNSNRH